MDWTKQDFDPGATGPLSGLRVVDLSRLVAGNMTSLQLADAGADVIKVEPLPEGDPLRAWRNAGVSTFWKGYCRNKRSLALDFRAEGAAGLLQRLLGDADVLIENFRAGTMEKMGLDPARLLEAHPRLIVLRVSGFGQTGPYGQRPGFGTLVEAMSGFAARNGEEGGDPLLPPLALADMISGLYGAFGIMTALRAREATGRGQVIDLSLLEPMASVLGPEPADFKLTGKVKPRVGNGSNTSSPRNVYPTRDGEFVALSASMQRMAERVLKLIGREDMLSDPRFSTNAARVKHRDEVDRAVGGWILGRDRADVLAQFEKAGITAAPILDAADISEDPHFHERGIFVEVPDDEMGSMPMHAPIPRLSETPGTLRFAAPRLGQHTRAVLAETGMTDDDIASALAAGLVAEAST
ncbi:CaiB/BaiF CoA transferase family protein [Lutibaculum baratangense]|uniref:CAIB/BAIF family protein n=1 Tax=Lutibaculum baratangense AMV1 TaxID=631454 RepID=V4R634_9HYPH|nr:CoA transferase [Lutibaculum baratangense]ESR27377.1 CAIB/BAIF family protein [Lutibaculum baratangense AMV1]